MRLVTWQVLAAFALGCISLRISAQPSGAAKACSPLTSPWDANTVKKGMPYQAKRVLQCEETLADGTVARGKSTSLEWRDSQGRFRRESLDSSIEGHELYDVQVFDPVEHVFWSWSVGKDSPHQAIQAKYNPEYTQGPIKHRFGRPLDWKGPNFLDVQLPSTWVHGVYATGERSIEICAPGQMGNMTGHPVKMVTEDWLSVALGEIVESRHQNADGSTENEDLYVLSRRDPDVSVFKPPADYEILLSAAGDSARTLDTLTKKKEPKKSRRSLIIVHPAQR